MTYYFVVATFWYFYFEIIYNKYKINEILLKGYTTYNGLVALISFF